MFFKINCSFKKINMRSYASQWIKSFIKSIYISLIIACSSWYKTNFRCSSFRLINNIFFYLCGFYTLFYLYYFMNLHKSNLVLVIILISSNIQNTIYHKYYEPLILIIVFLLFKNLNFESFFSKKINILYVYLSSLFYFLLRLIKNVYLF